MHPVLDNLPCGYLSFNDNGKIIHINQPLRAMLKLAEEKVDDVQSLLTIGSRLFYQTHFFPMLKMEGKVLELFMILRCGNGEEVPVITNAKRTLGVEDTLNECVFIAIPERVKYEREILRAKENAEREIRENSESIKLRAALESRTIEAERQYQRLLNLNNNLVQFNKIISHDLQEPIHKIKYFADVILTDERQGLSNKSLKAIDRISNSAERLQSLNIALQQYVAIEDQEDAEWVDLDLVIQDVSRKAIDQSKFSDVVIKRKNLPKLYSNSLRMELLFFHLFSNAIKFRDPTRQLEIDISAIILKENIYRHIKDKYRFVDHVQITFRDNGIGISEEYQDYIFLLLKKIDVTSLGIGMGLALAKRIVESHDGTIQMQSHPGQGSSFIISIPLDKPEQNPQDR